MTTPQHGVIITQIPDTKSDAADHAYLTAVVVLYETMNLDNGLRYRAETFIPGSPSALPLDHAFFRGPLDAVYEIVPGQASYVQTHPVV